MLKSCRTQSIYAYLGLKEEISKIFSQAQRAFTFDISPERNVWLQSALRLFAIVSDYMETAIFAIVCDLRPYGNQPLVFQCNN